MTGQTKEIRKQKIDKAKEALQRARNLRENRKVFGVDGISQLVDDVDGDWLENWSEEDTFSSINFKLGRMEFAATQTKSAYAD